MDCFTALESMQVTETVERKDAKRSLVHSRSRSAEKRTPSSFGATNPFLSGQEGQGEVEEVGFATPGVPVEPCVASTSADKCIITPHMQSPLPAWP